MRIITGSARGLQLETLAGEETRPTTDRVKEGVFSAIQFDIEGRQVLDLFAGSGQMGMEALSRGAAGCVFVDKNPEAVAVVRRNLNGAAKRDSAFQKNVQVINADSLAYLSQTRDQFDLAFLDPPYRAGLMEPCLRALTPHMQAGGIIVCETDSNTRLPEQAGVFALKRTYRYGKILVWLYHCLPEGDAV